MGDFIKLERIGRRPNGFVYEFDSSLDFFRRKNFFVAYDEPFSGAESLQTVPFAGAMAPLCWASGAELILPSLDEAYAASLERCRRHFQKWFGGRWAFSDKLSAPLVANDAHPTRTGLLFSGGLDSLTAFARNRERKPELFTIFGADIPVDRKDFIAACRRRLDTFADEQAVRIHYVTSDAREAFLDERLKVFSKNWYGEVSHVILMSSLLAPISSEYLKRLLVAGCSHRPGTNARCGGDSSLVKNIRWASTEVASDGYEAPRAVKIADLKKTPEVLRHLRVCWMQFEAINCGRCEKCLRTICELLVNNVDPAECGFPIDARTLPALRRRIETRYYVLFRGESALDFWRDIQDGIRLDALEDRYGSREFFAWLLSFKKLKKRQNRALVDFFTVLTDLKRVAEERLA